MTDMQYFPSQSETKRLSTDELRASFLVTDLFADGRLTLRTTSLDRAVIGGAVPVASPIVLEAPADFRADYFAERREIGVLNIGGNGRVVVDGSAYELSVTDGLYVGRGSRDVKFESIDPAEPARFYIVSYPAHASYPTSLIRAVDAQKNGTGTPARANLRQIARYIHPDGVRSAQLVMGVTTLETGSVWNTMPPHTHARRSEIYLYFNLAADAMVVHLMGEPRETRPLIVRDGEAALSPGWSIHSGCGTSSYSFCWAMGGENQDYSDMDPAPVEELK